MRTLSATFGMLMLAATVYGCADASEHSSSNPTVAAEVPGTTSTTSQALELEGSISADGFGDVLKGLAGKDILSQAKEVVASKLGEGGKLVEIAKAAVKDGGKFNLELPKDGGPLGIIILQAKNAAGAVVGSGLVNGAPTFAVANLQTTIDTVTSVKAEIVNSLAKNGDPQGVLNVLDAFVDTQLATAIATANVSAADLNNLYGVLGQGVVAAEGALVASLQGAGLPIDLTTLTNAQLSTVAGLQGVVTTTTGALSGSSTNLLASIEKGLSNLPKPTDSALFNSIVAASAMFNSKLKEAIPVQMGGGFDQSDLLFAGFKATFKLQTDLMTDSIKKAFEQAGTSQAALDALKKATADLLTQVDQAKNFASLDAAKAEFDKVLSGQGADTSLLGPLTTVANGVTSAITGLASALDPMAQNLANTLGGSKLTNATIEDALSKFDNGTKDLASQLAQLTSPKDAQAILDALKTSAKVFVP